MHTFPVGAFAEGGARTCVRWDHSHPPDETWEPAVSCRSSFSPAKGLSAVPLPDLRFQPYPHRCI